MNNHFYTFSPQILYTCKEAGVKNVIAADHYGMIFLLSNGPEQTGGIVYRNDTLTYPEMKKLAREINTALSPKINLEIPSAFRYWEGVIMSRGNSGTLMEWNDGQRERLKNGIDWPLHKFTYGCTVGIWVKLGDGNRVIELAPEVKVIALPND